MANKIKQLKIRKIGNSLGAIFPADWDLKEGEEIPYEIEDGKVTFNLREVELQRFRDWIEDGFADWQNHIVSEEEMIKEFGKYGWGDGKSE
ncbi:MAG: AbrB family transcriptional regulator [Lactobacillaceae bacterium]|nr:AbrB family transcriptional regulator [Lactobacillaceae bacterium]